MLISEGRNSVYMNHKIGEKEEYNYEKKTLLLNRDQRNPGFTVDGFVVI
jgi:hypothetical protein